MRSTFGPLASTGPENTSLARMRSPSLMRWLLYGPSLPPYQASRANELDAGWQWAILLAPTTFGLLLLLTVFAFASLRIADAPIVFMGTLAVLAGSVMLAGALFEWRWFFENRSARGLRYWVGDAGARWFYIITSGILLLLGIRLVGHAAMPTMAGKHPFFRITDGNGTAASLPSTSRRSLGERSALLGGHGGSPFERFDADYRPMVGIRYKLGNWSGQQVIAMVAPIFDHATTGERVVIAKDG